MLQNFIQSKRKTHFCKTTINSLPPVIHSTAYIYEIIRMTLNSLHSTVCKVHVGCYVTYTCVLIRERTNSEQLWKVQQRNVPGADM